MSFEQVRVVARVQDVHHVSENSIESTGRGVVFTPLPYYEGAKGFVRCYPRLRKSIMQISRSRDAFILRLPSAIAIDLGARLGRSGHPYGVEVVGDPYDVFGPGAVNRALRPLFRWWFTRETRRLVRGASSAVYVTRDALQRRYPPDSNVYSIHCSNALLTDSDFIDKPRTYEQLTRPHIVSVGSLFQMYKAPDIVIKALDICKQQGMDFTFDWIGGGKHQTCLERLAKSSGLSDRVRFLSDIPSGEPVRRNLDKADLFLLVSRTEGLPRALLEAMARGLPCIGSRVGGIPELLSDESLVRPGDPSALAKKIVALLGDHPRMRLESIRNLEKSKQYHDATLRRKRVVAYEGLRSAHEKWLRTDASR